MKHWHLAYRHIAELLNDFYLGNQSASVANRQMLKLLSTKRYLDRNRWLSQAKTKYSAVGVDPIQIFASFNNGKSNVRNRIENVNLLIEILGSEKRAIYSPDFFIGCPAPIITQVINSRKDIYQEQIWTVFSNIVSKGRDGLRSEYFDLYADWYGIDMASFTMFLFWIDSNNFLPLDQSTTTFLVGIHAIDHRPRNYKEYVKLCDYSDSRGLFRGIVKDAYDFVQGKKESFTYSKGLYEFIKRFSSQQNAKDVRSSLRQNFKIVAIKVNEKPGKKYPGDKQKHLKNLTENQIYSLSDSFVIKDDKTIEYTENIEDTLFNTDRLNISISGIVGKNGSGKSTITELLFLAINKLSYHKIQNPEEPLTNEEIFLDIYVKSDYMYRISVSSGIKFFKYDFNSQKSVFETPTEIPKERFNLEEFCYSIVINYSLYSLNSNVIGKWINPLFHKNDSYQVPIVLNPKRDDGVINVNVEEGLAKSRLLANLLDPKKMDFENQVVQSLVENAIPENLVIKFDYDKLARNRKRALNVELLRKKDIKNIEVVFETLGITDVARKPFLDEIKEYIFYKLLSICSYSKYSKYKRFYSKGLIQVPVLRSLLKVVNADSSHIAFKYRQAVNYLIHGNYRFGKKGIAKESILGLSEKINEIQLYNFEKHKLDTQTIDLVPPPFFLTNIEFKNGGSFDKLSSGEKQIIFSINTVVYHINNIDSVMSLPGVIKHSRVNVIFDEVELYFHPDMQRTFVNDLLIRLKTLELSYVNNINIIFVTHSPFILSDIPISNILKMENGKPLPKGANEQTFGANINDILANDFFLTTGFMGEFVKAKINSIIKYIEDGEPSNKDWDVVSAEKFINLIGEPLIKNELRDLFMTKFYEEKQIDAEIERLINLKNSRGTK